MRRRTRGGRNIKSLARRVTRRNQSAKLARKAKEKANQVIHESEKLQRQIQELSNAHQNEMEKIVLDLIEVSKEEKNKKTLATEDYIGSFKIRLHKLLDDPSRHSSMNQSFINFRKNLIQQYSTLANQLSTDSHNALNLSTKTPLSNRPNQIDNNKANEEMQLILNRTSQNISARPSSAAPNDFLKRMNLAIQIAHTMEYITYVYLVKSSDQRGYIRLLINNLSTKEPIEFMSLRVRSILEKNMITKSDLYPFEVIKSPDNYSTIIRNLVNVDHLKDTEGGITAIFQWLLDATDLAWSEAITAVKAYKTLSPNDFFTNTTLSEVYCYSSQYNLYFRLPILLAFNLKGKVLSDIGTIRFFKQTLLEWKEEELKYKPDPSALLRFYLKKQTRLQFVSWLKDKGMDQNSRMPQYMSLFDNYKQELKETEEWLQMHDPNRPKGFVRSEVARIDQQSTPKPSTAPISVKQPMKVAARPATTGWDRSMYNKRVKQEIDSMIKK